MYDATTVLGLIDANKTLVVLLGTIALLCNYVFFYEAAVRQSRQSNAVDQQRNRALTICD
ncbi:hypothetical protein EAH80_19200 [Mycobacterium hodleri]|uniref:Uncharacterized protein n=1 Tax=Mycolicibacterium hodleri TaxID=49897 RepID=A0A502E6F6_9MYCO|nr:hypothetical protein EAH80_19200 [Mycolicibacterium hodleri]